MVMKLKEGTVSEVVTFQREITNERFETIYASEKVRVSGSFYWETRELPLNEETIQEVNELITERTNGTAPVVTEEEIVQCYGGNEIAEHLEVKYEYHECRVSLYDIVNDILDQLINERGTESEFSLIEVDYEENSVIEK